MYRKWSEDADKRAPYIPYERVIPGSDRYTDYIGNLVIGSDLYTIKKGHVDAPAIVRIDDNGKEHRVCSYAYDASDLKSDSATGLISWSEGTPDERWTLKSGSKIRILTAKGRKKTLKSSGLLYNPAYSETNIATVRYYPDGRSSVNLLNSASGEEIKEFKAPDSLQFVEAAWIGKDIYTSAISENGYGLYKLDENGDRYDWECVLGPQPVLIKDLRTYGDELTFTCDRTGVNELYHFNPATGEVRQRTSTRYGAEDFQYSTDGKTLYYSSQTLMGKHLFRTPVKDLFDNTIKFDSLYKYPIAEKMKLQEIEAAKAQGYETSVTVRDEEVKVSESKRYRKVPHMFNMHTWFPAYVSVDNIMNSLSFDPMWETLSLGVSGVMQNHLATAIGEVGYSAHKDPYDASKWRHSGHFKLTYSGLYPIFKFSLDINDRSARQFYTYAEAKSGKIYKIDSRELGVPYIYGRADMYIPFQFSSGGWNKGLIPKFSYTISNDIFDTGMSLNDLGGTGNIESFAGYIEGKKTIRHSLSGSIRGYSMLPVANSQVYPRWGIGAEAGGLISLDSYKVLSPMGYVYAYGYIPGIMRTHGIKLTAMMQSKLRDDSPFSQQVVSILPRGLSSNSALGSHVSLYNEHLYKVTADYAIPIYIGDITLGGNLLTIKRLVAYPHFDYTFIGKDGLWSAGLDLTADLHAIVTLEWPCSFGLSFSWNGGSAWNNLVKKGISMNKWFVGPIFNVSF
jgi:hypothetical protein